MFRSLRWRITIPFTAILLLLLFLIGVLTSNFLKSIYINDLQSRQVAEARLIADDLLGQGRLTIPPGDLDTLASHWSEIIQERVTIITIDGTVIGESDEDRLTMENHLHRPEVQSAIKTGIGNSTRFSHTTGYSMMYTAYLGVNQSSSQSVIVRLATPLSEIDGNIRQFQTVILGVLLLVALFIIVIAGWIAARITKPLGELTREVQQLANPHPKISQNHDYDEIRQLTDSFNGMSSRLEALLRENEKERQRLEVVLEHMTDAVLIVDSSGQIVLFNKSSVNLFDIDEASALKTLAEVSMDHQVVDLWQTCIKTHQTNQNRIELKAQRKQVLAGSIFISDDGQGFVILFFQDITHQEQLEQMRRDFISNISHELRTPLAGIKAMAETLLDGALDDQKATKRFIERIQTEADALSLMVGELLELARIESGKVPLNQILIQPGEIVLAAVQRLTIQTEKAGIHLDLYLDPDLPDIMADPARLQQVMINILHNAIKFTPTGGQVSVRVEKTAETITIVIADTGKGIPAGDLPRIFERFYKVDKSRSSSGTGLGLSIARHLVEAHGGIIKVASEVGKGSQFTVQLPAPE